MGGVIVVLSTSSSYTSLMIKNEQTTGDLLKIGDLLKKHNPDFLPIDLVMKPWLRDLINAALEEGYKEGYAAAKESSERVMH